MKSFFVVMSAVIKRVVCIDKGYERIQHEEPQLERKRALDKRSI